ncbi:MULTISPECIES: hypothetical protein [Clostridium]|uniref:hypothetical protein n=1 Tax=Clostridium TaxID=1485 RepID=UPI000983E693|nr:MULTISPECIES: hypothetical protein [Clostridium]AQR95925.1 putative cell wall binding repeat protein [Clostridium saccharoperbutylacetonicum]NSB31792.1 hypothetical protein [Clostridium saccharoperbutylacetonicum]
MKLTKIIASLLAVATMLTIYPIGVSAEWKRDSNGWWNTEGDSWAVGWKQIDGKWYYFGQDGYMVHDVTIDGYKLGSDGAWCQTTLNNTSNSEQDIRKIAYNQLTSQDKARVKGTWMDSKVSEVTLNEGMGNIDDKSYIGKIVYLVDFQTQTNARPNNMIVYIAKDNHKLIGYGYVD